MSVSMLLNAANVVTAAERCHAIDQKNGRIPINFLLSRSTELDDHVKSQLQQLATHSPSLCISAPRAHALGAHTAYTHLTEQQALDDIDRESKRPERANRRALPGNRKQTLTKKAIRKATGSVPTSSPGAAPHSRSTSQGSASTASGAPRRRWKEWEDELLMHVVAQHGPTRWNTLARHFPGRNGRQVRLRWMNHLQPSLEKRPWRPEEDRVLMEAHAQLGNKWALISMRLCGRTDNSVKNRYKSIVRRAAREAKARKQHERHAQLHNG